MRFDILGKAVRVLMPALCAALLLPALRRLTHKVPESRTQRHDPYGKPARRSPLLAYFA